MPDPRVLPRSEARDTLERAWPVAMLTTYPSLTGSVGGVADYAKALVDALRERNRHVGTIVLAQRRPRPAGVSVVPAWRPGLMGLSLLRQLLDRNAIGLLHIQHEPLLYGLAGALRMLRLPRLAHRRGARCVVTLHAVPYPWVMNGGTQPRWFLLLCRVFLRYVRCLARDVDAFVVHEPGQREVLESAGIPPRKITLIPHGITTSRASGTRRSPAFTVGTFGYLSAYKDLDFLLSEFTLFRSRFPKTRLLFSLSPHPFRQGPVSRRKYRHTMQRAANLPGVTTMGHIPESELPGFLETCDVMVAPHRSLVSSSGVFARAAGAGVATLVPEGSALPLELSHWMYRYAPGGLAAALERFEGRVADASAQASALAANRSWERIATMHYDLYQRLA
jgi:glycosyltransferase involved in cell wall biosynthesis